MLLLLYDVITQREKMSESFRDEAWIYESEQRQSVRAWWRVKRAAFFTRRKIDVSEDVT